MKKAWTVAKWEYVERVKSKMFLVSLLIFPAVILTFAVLPAMLMTRTADTQKAMGLVDSHNILAQEFIERIEERHRLDDGQPMYVIRKIDEPNTDDETLRMIANSLVFAEEIEGYVYIPPDIYESNRPEYYSTSVGNMQDQSRFTGVIRDILIETRLEERGIDPSIVDEVVIPVNLRTVRIHPGGEEKESGFLEIFWGFYIPLIVLMMLVATSGQILIRSVVEEKTNRVIEVLASSCSPNNLIAGKIIGISMLGLTQVGLYAVVGALAISFLAIEGISFGSVWLLIPYFVFGYLFYAALFVVIGSPLSSEQEAQQVAGWAVIILMFPFIFGFIALQDPGIPIIRVLSMIPFFTPSFMILRSTISMPPVSDIIVSLGLLFVSTLIAMWMAAKIFRIAILSYGKRPSFKELLSWLRAG